MFGEATPPSCGRCVGIHWPQMTGTYWPQTLVHSRPQLDRGLTCWCVRSDLDFVSEQTTQLFFRTAGNRRKCGDIRSFITWAWSWAECQARDTDVVEGQVFGVN